MKRMSAGQKYLLLLLDASAFTLIFLLIYQLRLDAHGTEVLTAVSFWIVLALMICSQFLFSLYDLEWRHGLRNTIEKQIGSGFAIFFVTVLGNYLFAKERAGIFGRGILVGSLLGFSLTSVVVRFYFGRWTQRLQNARKLVFIAGPREAEIILNKARFPEHLNFEVVAPSDLSQWQNRRDVSWVMASRHSEQNSEIAAMLIAKKFEGEEVQDVITFVEDNLGRIPIDFVASQWLLDSRGFRLLNSPWHRLLKRLTDVLFASLLLLILWPVMLVVAIWIKLDSRGPVLYFQDRAGKDSKSFVIYKFRSMRTDAEMQGPQWAGKSDDRITRVGRFIRKTRLDETPQLVNILLGNMSFIGPRPERPEFIRELKTAIPYFQLRTAVAPGLTGWAQVLYPYGASIEDARNKLEFDLYYIKNYSLALDLAIILRTVQVVLRAKGR